MKEIINRTNEYEEFVLSKIYEAIADSTGCAKEDARPLLINALAYNTVVAEIVDKTKMLVERERSARSGSIKPENERPHSEDAKKKIGNCPFSDHCNNDCKRLQMNEEKYFERQAELQEMCRPINDWLQRNFNLHTKIIIEHDHAEVVEGYMRGGYGYLGRRKKHEHNQR
jgi:hypothetical protein